MRDRGTFTDVSVAWEVTTPSAALDVTPTVGVLDFTEGQTSASFQITALPDEVTTEYYYDSAYIYKLHINYIYGTILVPRLFPAFLMRC